MKTRGMGFCFQPTYHDKKTGAQKTVATWWVSYSVRGKRHKQSSESTNRADAVKLLKRRIGEVAQGKAVGNQVEKTSLADLLAMIEADYAANGFKSLRRLQVATRHLRDYFGGDTKAREITSDRITSFVVHRQEQKAAAATINMEQAFLARAFRLAAKAGKVNARPEMSTLRVDNSRKGFFEAEQFRAVLQHLPEHLRPIVTVGYFTGWRYRELTSRQWKDVDLKLGVLRLQPGESKNREAREFPLFEIPELKQVIEAQRARVSEIERATGRIIPWVFVNDAGEPLKDFRRSWKSAVRDAGCPGRLFHDLRRTAVRNLERAGVPRSVSMKLSGHKTEAVFRRYAITDSAMLSEGVAKLARMSEMSDANSQSTVKVRALPVKKR